MQCGEGSWLPLILEYVADGYLFVAPVCRAFYREWRWPRMTCAGYIETWAMTEYASPYIYRYITCDLALHGRLDALKKLYATRRRSVKWCEQVCALAAKGGHLGVLQWLRKEKNGLPRCPWDCDTVSYAAENGHLHILEWATTNGCPKSVYVCAYAAYGGHLHIIQWAREREFPWDSQTCDWAAENGHLHVIQWARANGCPWDNITSAKAAEHGDWRMLEWLHANGCPMNVYACAYAAYGGQLEVLKWLRGLGCPWDDSVCDYAAANGHLDIIIWAVEHGCDICMATVWHESMENGHRHIRDWLLRRQKALFFLRTLHKM